MASDDGIAFRSYLTLIGFILCLIATLYLVYTGLLSHAEFIMGTATVFLGFATIFLSLNEIATGKKNREQTRDLSARARAISTYPLLSQKIETKGVQDNVLIGGDDTQHYETHFRILIKNYGKGPAINQDRVYYRFFQRGRQVHQNYVPITGAHDIIAPGDERPLNMTELERALNRNDWNLEMEKEYDTIWVRLPHEDIQRNGCCNCTKYEYQPQIIGRFGKTERHWYFASYPEISSNRCRECEWRMENLLEDSTN